MNCKLQREKEKDTDRQTDRQTDRKKERKREREIFSGMTHRMNNRPLYSAL